MADMGAESISDAQLKKAAEARFCEGLPWNLCAECADISERHLRRLRSARDERWLEVVAEVQEALEDEALPTAIGTLVRMAAQNDVASAKALLDKWKATKLEHTGADGGPVQVEASGKQRLVLEGEDALAVVTFHEEIEADGDSEGEEGEPSVD